MTWWKFPHLHWAGLSEPHSADINTILSDMGGAAPYAQPASTDFDGTQNIRWNTAPNANSNLFTAIIKFKRGTTGSIQNLLGYGGRVDVRFSGVDTLTVICDDTSNVQIVLSDSASTLTDTASAHVLMLSVNTTTQTISAYIDDTSYAAAAPTWSSTNAIHLARRMDIGADGGAAPNNFFNGCIGPVWISDNEYIDFTNSANRDLVISSAGVIKDPGTNGVNWSPTSTAPEIYIEDTFNAPGTNDGLPGTNPDATPATPTACT